MEGQNISYNNNFNLLRLVAALQVFIIHVSTHFEVDIGVFRQILGHLPGIPVFFTISGFLITMSYDKNRNIKRYFYNRFLRIYPALWVCTIFTIITLLIFKAFSFRQLFSKDIISWFFASVTIFQYYTPDILRSWGVSAPNGSLWTIPVEIEFYILIPLIFLIIKKINLIFKLILLFILSYLINRFISPLVNSSNETIIVKLIEFSLFPHLFNFIIGSVLYYLWDSIKKYIENKALFWALLYVCYIVLFEFVLELYHPSYYPNMFGLISTVLLSIMTVSLGFTNRGLTARILKGNDISYGIYIYHMPIINIFVHQKKNIIYPPPPHGSIYGIGMLFLVFVIVVCLAYISWVCVEKKALALKTR